MKINVLKEEEMRNIGFTDHRKGFWYLCKVIKKDITFNLSIQKNGTKFEIDVLDERFLQSYDYQYMLHNNPKFNPALKVKKEVNKVMLDLIDKGIVADYKIGDYI